jgi:hypothetical protein
MQTAFQSGAFQASGFQIVATVQQQGGGYGWGAYDHEARRRKRDKELRDELEREEAAELAREIAALEEHIAEDRNVSRETVRLQAKVRTYEYLPPYVLQAAERALKTESARAFQQVEKALAKYEQEEEEEIAVLIAAMH